VRLPHGRWHHDRGGEAARRDPEDPRRARPRGCGDLRAGAGPGGALRGRARASRASALSGRGARGPLRLPGRSGVRRSGAGCADPARRRGIGRRARGAHPPRAGRGRALALDRG